MRGERRRRGIVALGNTPLKRRVGRGPPGPSARDSLAGKRPAESSGAYRDWYGG